MKVSVIDIETSGGVHNCPVQIAYDVFKSEEDFLKGFPAKSICFYILPDDEILPCTIAVHGSQRKDLIAEGAENLRDCASQFATMWQDLNGGLVVGYGIKQFDMPLLQETSRRIGVSVGDNWAALDVLDFARRTEPVAKIGDFKLDSVAIYLFPADIAELLEQRAVHQADVDCIITLKVVRELLRRQGMTVEQAFWFMDTPVKVELFPFGKFKGKPIGEVAADSGYCDWLSKQAFFVMEYPDAAYSICIHGKDEAVIGPRAVAAIKAARGSARLPTPEPVAVTADQLQPHPTEVVRPRSATFEVGLVDVPQVLKEVAAQKDDDPLPF